MLTPKLLFQQFLLQVATMHLLKGAGMPTGGPDSRCVVLDVTGSPQVSFVLLLLLLLLLSPCHSRTA
jgi:hypothetical protein